MKALQQSGKRVRLGCISNTAFYGGFLFAYPIVGGGFIGSILMACGVSQNTAYLIGLSVAYALSVPTMILFVLCGSVTGRFKTGH